jgi:hypothetical protein
MLLFRQNVAHCLLQGASSAALVTHKGFSRTWGPPGCAL